VRAGLDMPRKLPRYCVEDVDRYGKSRIYLGRKGQKKTRLKGLPWSQPFMDAYQAALEGSAAPKPGVVIPRSWRWLCHQCFGSAASKALDAHATQPRRRAALEVTFDEPIKPGTPILFGDVQVSKLTTAAVRAMRDRKAAESKDGANARLKAIRGVFKWATTPGIELCDHNPSRDVPPLAVDSEGTAPGRSARCASSSRSTPRIEGLPRPLPTPLLRRPPIGRRAPRPPAYAGRLAPLHPAQGPQLQAHEDGDPCAAGATGGDRCAPEQPSDLPRDRVRQALHLEWLRGMD